MENPISEMFGVAEPDDIFEYIEKNWKTIDYPTEVRNLLVKFQAPERVTLATREKYEEIRIRCEFYISKDHTDLVSGHYGYCKGGGLCRCTYHLFDQPRNLIGEMIHMHYSTMCITKMVRRYSFEYVMTHFEKNWRRMDLTKVMKGMLRLINKSIGGDTYTRFYKTFKEEYRVDPDVRHDQYNCVEVFYAGVLTCHCDYFVSYSRPKAFIRDMVETYYRKTNRK